MFYIESNSFQGLVGLQTGCCKICIEKKDFSDGFILRAMEVQRVRGGEGSPYAKQQPSSRAKPSGMETKTMQSKIQTLPRRMRAKSAHVTTFVEAEDQRTQSPLQRKSPKLGDVRLLGEDDTPESERNLPVPRTWVRCTV